MKQDITMRDAISAALYALTAVIATAQRDLDEAYYCIEHDEQNMAIGTMLPVEDALEQALSLYRAIIAMHRFKP